MTPRLTLLNSTAAASAPTLPAAAEMPWKKLRTPVGYTCSEHNVHGCEIAAGQGRGRRGSLFGPALAGCMEAQLLQFQTCKCSQALASKKAVCAPLRL